MKYCWHNLLQIERSILKCVIHDSKCTKYIFRLEMGIRNWQIIIQINYLMPIIQFKIFELSNCILTIRYFSIIMSNSPFFGLTGWVRVGGYPSTLLTPVRAKNTVYFWESGSMSTISHEKSKAQWICVYLLLEEQMSLFKFRIWPGRTSLHILRRHRNR